jgi:oxygen-dependent protoporphyrinogen oxidase
LTVSAPEVGAVVVGAGIAGLAAALELQTTTREILTLDASDRPGGVLRTDHVAGYVVERGPNTIQVKAPMLELLRRLELNDRLLRAEPESRKRYLYRDGNLVPVPTSPPGLVGTKLLSTRAKFRMLAEPLLRRGDPSQESVAEFVGRRLGSEVVENLIGPFLTGLYAGDENQLGAEAVFGGLTDLEKRHRSLLVGALLSLGRRGPRGLRGVYSTAEGLGPFARRMSEMLIEPPALGTRVIGIRLEGRHWQVIVSAPTGEQRFRTRRVVIAAPAYEAARILDGIEGDFSTALEGVTYAPILGLAFGVEPEKVRTPIEGFGFLVPRDSGLQLLGCLFMSRLFPNRAPKDRQLLQCMFGGVRWPEGVDLPDDAVIGQALQDLDRTLGLEAEPKTLALTRWRRAIPQPGRDHVSRIAAVREGLGKLPGIAIAGSYVNGVGVADSLASGIVAARAVSDSTA